MGYMYACIKPSKTFLTWSIIPVYQVTTYLHVIRRLMQISVKHMLDATKGDKPFSTHSYRS